MRPLVLCQIIITVLNAFSFLLEISIYYCFPLHLSYMDITVLGITSSTWQYVRITTHFVETVIPGLIYTLLLQPHSALVVINKGYSEIYAEEERVDYSPLSSNYSIQEVSRPRLQFVILLNSKWKRMGHVNMWHELSPDTLIFTHIEHCTIRQSVILNHQSLFIHNNSNNKILVHYF